MRAVLIGMAIGATLVVGAGSAYTFHSQSRERSAGLYVAKELNLPGVCMQRHLLRWDGTFTVAGQCHGTFTANSAYDAATDPNPGDPQTTLDAFFDAGTKAQSDLCSIDRAQCPVSK